MYFTAEIADEHILRTVRGIMDLRGATESSERADVVFCDESSAEKFVGRIRCVVLYRDRKFPQSKEYKALCSLGEFYSLKVPFSIDKLVREVLEEGVAHSTAESAAVDATDGAQTANRAITVEGRTVTVGDKAVELTTKEFGLFDYLYNRAGKIVSREELLREVWKRDTESNIVDVYASYLRRKLDFILPPGCLTAVRGLGYVLKI